MIHSRYSVPCVLLSISAGLFSCSGSSEGPNLTPTVGGAPNNGGSAATIGGATNGASQGGAQNALGGNPGSGGTATSSSNGGQSMGGNATTGGQSNGGNSTIGGATASAGGNTTTGGAVTAIGGAVSTGGKGGTASTNGGADTTTTGGAATTGGKGGTGGVIATGGTATGGATTTTTGGTTTSTGGTTNGACVESTCGTHKWACWKVPTPVSENLPNPQSYTDLGNGAVRDNVTCLVWEKTNPSAKSDWTTQYNRCAALASSSYAGFSDWRLPTRMELASITDVTLGSTGYPRVFAVTGGYYTTGSDWYKTILTAKDTTAGNELDLTWGYGTNGFTSNNILRTPADSTKPELVSRCVRGNGNGEAAGEYAVEPANHYTIASGEVTDNYTGLIWQQGFSPTTLSHADAVTYCSTLSLNGRTGWRVPALNELASTVNEAKVGGAIVATAFPGNPVGCAQPQYWFWAAESYGSYFWGLSYCDGFTGYNSAAAAWNTFPTANARCVRNGP